MTNYNDWFDAESLDEEGRNIVISISNLREHGYTDAQIRDIQHPRDPETGKFIARTYEVTE